MSVQRLTPFEKTSIQARHSIKRLEMYVETARTDDEKELAEKILAKFKEIRSLIPNNEQDVDIREKE
jgi:hypothetical protein